MELLFVVYNRTAITQLEKSYQKRQQLLKKDKITDKGKSLLNLVFYYGRALKLF